MALNVRKENRKVTPCSRHLLKQHQIHILLHVSAGLCDLEIAKKLDKARSTICEHLKNLRELGWVECEIKDVFTQHRLTKKGQNFISEFLSGYDITSNQIRAHNVQFKCQITRKPKEFHEHLKSGGSWIESVPHNWKAYRKRLQVGWVTFTPNNLLINLFDQFGTNPEHAYSKALEKAIVIKSYLEQEYPGLVLGEPSRGFCMERSHFALQNNAITELCAKLKVNFEGERLQADHSHGVPELETIHPKHALDDAIALHTLLHKTDELLAWKSAITDRISDLEKEVRDVKTAVSAQKVTKNVY